MDPIPLRGPRIRRAPIPENARLILRGHDLDHTVASRQAEAFRRRYPNWGRYGLSAYYAATGEELDDIAADLLERFALFALFDLAILRLHGFDVVPTFRTPHVTISFAGQLAEQLRLLASLPIEIRENPYHEREPARRHNEDDRT